MSLGAPGWAPCRAGGRALAIIASLGACAAPGPAANPAPAGATAVLPAAPAASRCAPNDARPSRQGFLHEVLFAQASPRTPRFDDYTPGSYHVDKLDLAQALPAEAARCGQTLHGLLVIGPNFPLWTYHVIALLGEGDSVRVNFLLMPHARITAKATRLMPAAHLPALWQAMTASPLLRAGAPALPPANDLGDRDFSYKLLLVQYGDRGARYWHADYGVAGEKVPGLAQLLAPVNRVLEGMQDTYPHDRQASRSAVDAAVRAR